jgi:hypothetical protein
MPIPPLRSTSACPLAHLYAEKESPKFEKAAMRVLARYITERSPRLREFATVAASLARRENGE